MRIEDLKSLVAGMGGVALPNLYKVVLPQIAGSPATSTDLNIMCKSVAMPGRQVTSLDYAIGTVTRKIANSYLVSEVNLTFNVTNNHLVTDYFQKWQNLAHNQETYEVGYYEDYTKVITIQQLERENLTPVKTIRLFEAYPTTMNEMEMRDDANNVVTELGVSISFKDWEVN